MKAASPTPTPSALGRCASSRRSRPRNTWSRQRDRVLHDRGRLHFRPSTAAWTRRSSLLSRRSHRERVHSTLGVRIQPGDRAHPGRPARLGHDPARRTEPGHLYPQAAAAGLIIRWPPPSIWLKAMSTGALLRPRWRACTTRSNPARGPTAATAFRQTLDDDPDDPYIGEMARDTYFTIHLYAEAARLAHTVYQQKVKRCLTGLEYRSAGGKRVLEPGTHHCADPTASPTTKSRTLAFCAIGR